MKTRSSSFKLVLRVICDCIPHSYELWGLYQLADKRPCHIFRRVGMKHLPGYIETIGSFIKLGYGKPWIKGLVVINYIERIYDGTSHSVLEMLLRNYQMYEPRFFSSSIRKYLTYLVNVNVKRHWWFAKAQFSDVHGIYFGGVIGKQLGILLIQCLIYIQLVSVTQKCLFHHFFHDATDRRQTALVDDAYDNRLICSFPNCPHPTLLKSDHIASFPLIEFKEADALMYLRKAIGLSIFKTTFFGDFWKGAKFIVANKFGMLEWDDFEIVDVNYVRIE